MKICCECEKPKPKDDYHRSSSRGDGRQSICKECALPANRASTKLRRIEIRKTLNIIKSGSCKIGDKVIYKGKHVLVQKIMDYCPEMRKSYIKGCAIDKSGRPLLCVDVFPGYDWKMLR